jgi:hypothetical protein
MANESVKAGVKVTREAAYIGDFKFNFQGNLIEKYIEMKDAGKLDKYEKEVMELMAKHYAFYGQFQEENEYITRGSILRCSGGNKMNTFDILNDHGVEKAGSPLGICTDCKANENIHTFGECKKPTPEGYPERPIVIPTLKSKLPFIMHKCIPILNGSWSKTKSSKVKIWNESVGKYVDAITTGDFLVCLYGGIIEVVEIPTVNGTKGSVYPLNDYKTKTNSNLVGTGSSKNYISLAQLKSFNFEYNRQTYINKLAGYNANDFQGVVSNATAYLNEIKIQLDYLNNEFSNISDQNIVSNFNYHIEKYGIGKYDEAVLMFMAITAQESLYGKRMVELWDSTLGYAYNQRGGGYSQLTGIAPGNPNGNQVDFLSSVGYSNNDISNILDQPFHIGTYLPMSSACYAWTTGNAIACDLTTDIIEYGIKQGAEMRLIYLAISYAINGYKSGKSGLQTLLKGKTFSEPSSAPNGWADRKRSYNDAIKYFPHGSSTFIPFIV